MATYQARALSELAARMVVTADVLPGASVVMGLLAGWAAGSSVGNGAYAFPCALIGAVVFGAVGYVSSLVLRALAQLMLCQVQIEAHTRCLADAGSGASPVAEDASGSSRAEPGLSDAFPSQLLEMVNDDSLSREDRDAAARELDHRGLTE